MLTISEVHTSNIRTPYTFNSRLVDYSLLSDCELSRSYCGDQYSNKTEFFNCHITKPDMFLHLDFRIRINLFVGHYSIYYRLSESMSFFLSNV